MHDFDPKWRHFGIFAKKSDRKSDPIFPILRLFPTSRLSDSTALVKILYDHYITASNDELLWLRTLDQPFLWQVQLLRHPGQRDCLDGAGWLGREGCARLRPGWWPRDSDHVLPISHCSSSMFIRIFTFCSDSWPQIWSLGGWTLSTVTKVSSPRYHPLIQHQHHQPHQRTKVTAKPQGTGTLVSSQRWPAPEASWWLAELLPANRWRWSPWWWSWGLGWWRWLQWWLWR